MIALIITIASLVLLVFLSGYFNGIMDYIKKFNLDSESWKNKWKWNQIFINNEHPMGMSRTLLMKSPWYYFGLFKPEYEEKFPYSSTILVFLTDDWHFKKWLTFLCYELIVSLLIVSYEDLPLWCVFIGIAILKTVRGLGFSLKYDKKLK